MSLEVRETLRSRLLRRPGARCRGIDYGLSSVIGTKYRILDHPTISRRTSRILPHPPEVSRSSTSSLKLRVAIWGADTVGPSRRARLWTLTKYMGGGWYWGCHFRGRSLVNVDDQHQIKIRFGLTRGLKIYMAAGFEMQLWSGYQNFSLV